MTQTQSAIGDILQQIITAGEISTHPEPLASLKDLIEESEAFVI